MSGDEILFFKAITVIGILLLFVFITMYYVNVIIPFKQEKMYIKSEIGRSSGRERKYWQHKLKMLYVSQIPLLGRVILRFLR